MQDSFFCLIQRDENPKHKNLDILGENKIEKGLETVSFWDKNGANGKQKPMTHWCLNSQDFGSWRRSQIIPFVIVALGTLIERIDIDLKNGIDCTVEPFQKRTLLRNGENDPINSEENCTIRNAASSEP